MSLDTSIAKTQATLEAMGVPAARAAVKAEGTTYGKWAAVAGVALIFASLGMLVLVDVTVVSALLLGGFVAVGFAMFGIGFSLISRDAAPVVKLMGEWIVSIVRAFRGKEGG